MPYRNVIHSFSNACLKWLVFKEDQFWVCFSCGSGSYNTNMRCWSLWSLHSKTMNIVKHMFRIWFFFFKINFGFCYILVLDVGGGGGRFGLFPNVVSAVELTPNNTMKTAKSIVKLPHCVNRLSGSILFYFRFFFVVVYSTILL